LIAFVEGKDTRLEQKKEKGAGVRNKRERYSGGNKGKSLKHGGGEKRGEGKTGESAGDGGERSRTNAGRRRVRPVEE